MYRVNFVGSISSNLYSSRSMSACSFLSFFLFFVFCLLLMYLRLTRETSHRVFVLQAADSTTSKSSTSAALNDYSVTLSCSKVLLNSDISTPPIHTIRVCTRLQLIRNRNIFSNQLSSLSSDRIILNFIYVVYQFSMFKFIK